ncbi:MAG: conjugal transfer protein TraG N-terminal domain-containing protein [Burkholderiales bacterium]|nr:conjugal transfer protein TraG N-terminal domain-containing protein [Burkholderiales bacterium]
MWEIYAYQNADSLFGVFNAAAAIHASGDYAAALGAVAFCGFAAALLAYAFAPEKLQGWKWLATVVLVYGVLVLPRVTLGIVDRTGGSAVKVVDNVPFGVAALGSLTSTIGHTLTGLFETAFQVIPGTGALPAELSYERHGLMFGNRLIREAGTMVFQDPNFRTDLIQFIHNCTSYDLLDGTLDRAGFSAAGDVWALMSTPNPARFTTLSSGAASVVTCTDAYANLNTRLPVQVGRLQAGLALTLHPTLPANAAAAVIAGQVQQAYLKNGIADAAQTAADLIRQNALLNAIEDTGQLVGQKINDPAAMALAVGRAQATAQQNATWINQGKLAEQALPVLRNVVEALSFALFPLLVLMLLLSSGRDSLLLLKGYALVMVWIQLWPPLFAVLNYMASIYAAQDLAAAADLGSGVRSLSLRTASSIYARAISGEAVVGHLALAVPLLAWALVKRLEGMGSTLVGGLGALQGTLSAATGGAAAGNLGLGNVTMDQAQLAPNRSSAFMSHWQDDRSGNTFSANALTGRSAVSLLRKQGFASRVVSMRVSEQEVSEASRQADAAQAEATSLNRERSAALTEAFSRGVNQLKSNSQSTASSSSRFEQLGSTLNRLDQISRSVSERTGVSQSQVAQIAFGARAALGLSILGSGGKLQADAGKRYQAALSSEEQKVLGAMSSEQLSEFRQFGERVSRDRSLVELIGSDSREGRELASRLATTTAQAEKAESSYTERRQRAERLSSAHERGESISIDIAQDPHNLAMFLRYAEAYGGSSASAQALMDAELARRGLPPNRQGLEGAALPSSFEEWRAGAGRSGPASEAGGGVERARVSNDAEVVGRSWVTPAVAGAQAPREKGGRVEFDDRAKELKGQVASSVSSTSAAAERRDQSLLGQVSQQAVDDARATAKEVGEAAGKLFDKVRK